MGERPSRRTTSRWAGAVSAGVALAGTLTSCSSGTESYCDALKADRPHLTRLATQAGKEGPSGTAAFSGTVRLLAGLRDRAPDDVSTDYDTLVTALQGLQEAIRASGASPAELGSGTRPDGVTAGEYSAVQQAAAGLQTTEVQQASRSIEQHARDVCKVDLGSGLGGAG